MKNKSILIYGVIFVVLLLLVFLTVYEGGDKTTSYRMPEKLFVVDSASVDKIEFDLDGKKYVIEKVGMEWRFVEPYQYRIESRFIPAMLSDLQNYKLESLVSDNPTAHMNFGFTENNNATFRIYQQGEEVALFEVGKASDGAAQTFIRLPGDEKVFLASNFLRNNFVKSDPNEWRDKLIFSVLPGNIESVEFDFPNDKYNFTWDTTGNYFVSGVPADTVAVDGFLNLMQNFNTQTFWDEPIELDASFDHKITLNRNNDEPITLRLKKMESNGEENYLLSVSGIKQIFKFNQGLAGNLIKSRTDYLKK